MVSFPCKRESRVEEFQISMSRISVSQAEKKRSKRRYVMTVPIRVAPEEVYKRVKSGLILLVCAYEDDERFKNLQLEGAISFNEFKSKLPSLSKDQEIVFY
jgi:hypothetical protein